MALIKCPECGREISEKASACPGCGCPASEFAAGTNQENDNVILYENLGEVAKEVSAILQESDCNVEGVGTTIPSAQSEELFLRTGRKSYIEIKNGQMTVCRPRIGWGQHPNEIITDKITNFKLSNFKIYFNMEVRFTLRHFPTKLYTGVDTVIKKGEHDKFIRFLDIMKEYGVYGSGNKDILNDEQARKIADDIFWKQPNRVSRNAGELMCAIDISSKDATKYMAQKYKEFKIDRRNGKYPDIEYCPHCGSQNIEPYEEPGITVTSKANVFGGMYISSSTSSKIWMRCNTCSNRWKPKRK